MQLSLKRFIHRQSPINKKSLIDARKLLSVEIKAYWKRYNDSKLADAIKSAEEDGISSLYKPAKRSTPPHSSTVPLNTWKEFCVSLYQSLPPPDINNLELSSVPTEQGSFMLKPITNREIYSTIKCQKSKAKDQSGISPHDLKAIASPLANWLEPIFNSVLKGEIPFPTFWLNSTFFFLHKKGNTSDPSNYRSLAIESSILKTVSYTHLTLPTTPYV